MDYQSFQPNPPAPQTPQQTSSVQKTFTPKFIWVIIALLVLGGTAYAGLWFWNDKNKEAVAPTFTPRPDPTADWQTYRNEEYGFEFKYPDDWVVRDLTSGANHDKSVLGFFGAGPVSVPEDTFFNVIVYSSSLDQKILDETQVINSNPNQELVSIQDRVLFNKSGKQMNIKNRTTNETFSFYFFYENGRAYVLAGDVQILSTFKFIDLTAG